MDIKPVYNSDDVRIRSGFLNQMNNEELKDLLLLYMNKDDEVTDLVFNLGDKTECLERLNKISCRISHNDEFVNRYKKSITEKWAEISKKYSLFSEED